MTRRLLKAARDRVADALAERVFRRPALEPPFVATGKILWRLPLARTLYRRATDTLSLRLRAADRQFREVEVGGLKLCLDVTDFTARGLFFLSAPYEPATTRWMVNHLGPGDTVVDVGANHGYHTLVAAALVGSRGHVFAFEPNPEVLAQLERHVRLNRYHDRVSACGAALAADARDDVDFFVADSAINSGLSSLLPGWEGLRLAAARTIRIQTVVFDDWLQAAGLERVDLMKIDVEGAEDLVLRGMHRALQASPPARIICETHPDRPAHARLVGHGYRPSLLEWVGPSHANILYTHQTSA